MLYGKCSANRARLVDEPIVEMLMTNTYYKSGIKFMHADIDSDFKGADIICSVNGVSKAINVKRNSSKYWNSPNFTITFHKDKLGEFNNSTYVYIDEVANCLYLVRGEELLKYLLQKMESIKPSNNGSTYYVVCPKKDMAELSTKGGTVIKYSNTIARLFETGRDESMYDKLV